jgi:putative intracellular protease/amidase
MPKVLILTGDAAEDLEVMYPYQRLLEEGYEVDVAAPAVKTLQFVVHDFVDGFDTYTEKLGHSWPADVAFADVNPSDYVAVVVPGGHPSTSVTIPTSAGSSSTSSMPVPRWRRCVMDRSCSPPLVCWRAVAARRTRHLPSTSRGRVERSSTDLMSSTETW